MDYKETRSGLALLLAIIVVSVVVSIGLSVLDVSIKQLQLSTNYKDSEIVFHAVNAGLECARYIRVSESDDIESGGNVSSSCFGTGVDVVDSDTVSSGVTDGVVHSYDLEASWGDEGQRCSKMKIVAFDPTTSNQPMSVAGSKMEELIPGYPYGDKDCDAGALCTVISVQGFNRECGSINEAGTIQREVLLEL
jgi:Tfp pilus assembly protein PilX